MSATKIEKKQELMKAKKRELVSSCVTAASFVAVYLLVVLSLLLFFADQPVISSVIRTISSISFIFLFGVWSNMTITPIANEIRELKAEIKEAKSAQWRDEVISRINSGQLKPL